LTPTTNATMPVGRPSNRDSAMAVTYGVMKPLPPPVRKRSVRRLYLARHRERNTGAFVEAESHTRSCVRTAFQTFPIMGIKSVVGDRDAALAACGQCVFARRDVNGRAGQGVQPYAGVAVQVHLRGHGAARRAEYGVALLLVDASGKVLAAKMDVGTAANARDVSPRRSGEKGKGERDGARHSRHSREETPCTHGVIENALVTALTLALVVRRNAGVFVSLRLELFMDRPLSLD
jgi:hypothetical protein